MAVTDKVKALLSIKGKKNIELAAHLGISEFTYCTLAFEVDGSQKIILDKADIRE